MNAVTMPEDLVEANGPGFIGRIPVSNLWLLMLYASDLFRAQDSGRASQEESPDDLPDLVAEILAREVERRLRRQLSRTFHERDAVLDRVRGRIDILATERNGLLARGLVACRFDELTLDTARNRYVRAALASIARIVKRTVLRHRCSSLAKRMQNLGIADALPADRELHAVHLGRCDVSDWAMLAAAKLAFELLLPSEEAGTKAMPRPSREVAWVRQLFERAIGGFYDVVLGPAGWKVQRSRPLYWDIQHKTGGIDAILPGMRTDIMLDHTETGRRLVIDTKFTSIVTQGWHREETLRSHYLYQIYAYLHSQVGKGDLMADTASGLLLHPAIGTMIKETVVIQGHAIRFATVDLAAPASVIREQLLEVCNDL